ncbi:hypothetical protein B0H19DRAFT_1277577 [Mycena capillaripes]|nr:hypothetical protein B0H19DRAFT_1277577 [Mycena capillaripes]
MPSDPAQVLTMCVVKSPLLFTFSDVHTSFSFAIGHVTGAFETLEDGHSSRAFPLAVNDYVGNGTVASTIQAVYDFSTTRFKSTPIPALNSCVEIYGPCRESIRPAFFVSKWNLSHLILPGNAENSVLPL